MKVIFSDRFENELFAIADYISLYSEKRADLFVEEVNRVVIISPLCPINAENR